MFWLLIGCGLGRSFRVAGRGGDMNYLEYFFPGTLILIVLFTAVFSMISVIEDRREGYLQAVLASPTPRTAIALGKILGSTTLAVGQAAVFLLLTPWVTGVSVSAGAVVLSLLVLTIVGVGLSALGFLIAWPMDSTQGFHAIMNLFLIPMWLLSGALFPGAGASAWLAWVIRMNPLTYGVSALRQSLYLGADGGAGAGPSLAVSIAVTIVFASAATALAARLVAGTARPRTA
ncbi:MAG: ABC transporter permease [Phycisphaerae bacterium]